MCAKPILQASGSWAGVSVNHPMTSRAFWMVGGFTSEGAFWVFKISQSVSRPAKLSNPGEAYDDLR